MSIDNNEDLIDSRDIIERINELQAVLDAGESLGDDRDEYMVLTALANDGEQSASDWADGAALIRDSYFENYARELAEDLGLIDDAGTWPNYCIDWARAARELRADYTAIDFDGVTYWVRD